MEFWLAEILCTLSFLMLVILWSVITKASEQMCSTGYCPRCGVETDEFNNTCYQCALRRVRIALPVDAITDYDENDTAEYYDCYSCDDCGMSITDILSPCPNCGWNGLG